MAAESRYLIEVAAVDDGGPPAAIRLRRALKFLLRSFGLRVLQVSEVGTPVARNEGADSGQHHPCPRGPRPGDRAPGE